MIDVLKDTLSKVNDWIKFAEAKNAANVAFCSASIWALLRMIGSGDNIVGAFLIYIYVCVAMLSIGLCLSFVSFIPKLSSPWISLPEKHENDNLLFFGAACKYSGESYLKKLYDGKIEKIENYALERMYAEQIVINSKVAWIKFKQFDIAIAFTLSAILTPLFLFIFRLSKK
ncbi:hypothetical protein B4939_13015 [Vibrio cholerae]|uniref:Pycsar system effector family protein n=1 Tax=Vibrio cholerae TaxID=666 RepID=UPI001159B62F|nr:Pycsar system effector family protein [Vibrio cholerae]MCD1230319.1 hypothetical protein [Vibrio cholerae]TQO99638.1 hypothetical protein FLM11_08865 [Vibrio cholerae]